MPRIAAVTAGVVVLLLVAAQVVLPRLAEGQVADRLEERGGSADVSISAFPAVRLLFGDGDRIEVDGRDLRVPARQRRRALERLDGFDAAEVNLRDVGAGPLAVSSFVLRRAEGDKHFALELEASTTPREVAAFIGTEAGGTLGGVLGGIAGGTLPGGGNTELPIELRAAIRSREGRVEANEVTGAVAGIPAGPLAELVVSAVADRL